ncbi:unnamed protein product [Allacma fusca]|uniref:V-SNARE coiled-coil homology domain-containing protein n=1 Tax=Allacma fusca TaxID=39272 RepID=A0A8J2JJP3_9HEXA|nr:unnamed protein product [Allacma fusca]
MSDGILLDNTDTQDFNSGSKILKHLLKINILRMSNTPKKKRFGSNRRTTIRRLCEENEAQAEILLVNEKETKETKKDYKIENMKKEVGVVMDIMRKNIENIEERDNKLQDLEVISENLNNSSQSFRKNADALSEKNKRANRKMKIYVIIISLIVIVVVGAAVYFVFIHN